MIDYLCANRAYALVGDTASGTAHYEQALSIARRLRHRLAEALASWYLGLLHETLGDYNQTAALMRLRVDFERAVGHTEADEHARKLDQELAKASEART